MIQALLTDLSSWQYFLRLEKLLSHSFCGCWWISVTTGQNDFAITL